MNKYLLIPVSAGLLLLAACNTATVPSTTTDDESSTTSVFSDTDSNSMTSSEAMMEDASEMNATSSRSTMMQASSATAVDTSSKTHEIAMTVDNFLFAPNAVTFKKGEKAVIHLTGINGIHGFGARDLGINVRVSPGQTVDITIPTDKTGTFSFRCTVPCGPGHSDMTGNIVIE